MSRYQSFPNRGNGCHTSPWLIFEHCEKLPWDDGTNS